MENATDALIMAGSMLLLVIALSVSISSLSKLRVQAQDILSERNKIKYTQDDNGYMNFLKSNQNDRNDIRVVGIETIISAITRMRKESYTVYIATNESLTDIPEEIRVKESDIDSKLTEGKNVIKLTASDTGNRFLEDDSIKSSLYNQLNSYTFEEYIGVYQRKSGASEANKSTYKIITFVQT